MKRSTILLFIITCFALNPQAQEKMSFKTDLSFGGNYQTGNTEKTGLSFSGQVAANDSLRELSFNTQYNYGEDRGNKNVQNYLLGLQYDHRPLSDFSPFLRAELYSNTFQMIEQRYSGLVGAKYRFAHKHEGKRIIYDYSLSTAFVFDHEHYTHDAQKDDKEKIRLSIRPKVTHELMENIQLTALFFYQPNISDFGDYLLNGVAGVNYTVNKYIFLKTSYEYRYNSRPASSSVQKEDTLLLMSLGVKF